MITKLSQIITDFFIKEKIINENQRDIYIYGFQLCICSVISLVIVLLVALITKMYYECAIYYIIFSITRLFSGGFHAETFLKCKITYVGGLLATLELYRIFYILPPIFWFTQFAFSSIIIGYFAPVENINKPLTISEKKRAKIITVAILVLWLILSGVLCFSGVMIYHMIPLTLFFIAILMVLGNIKEGGRRQ